jgi:hypothetical protein
MNKKSVVFTFITVILLSIIIIAFLVNIHNRTQTRTEIINVKVETLNSFVKNLNSSYLPNALRTSSNQVMFSLLDYESNNTYVSDINSYFKDVLKDGYYGSEKQNDMFQNKLDYTLMNTLEEVKLLAEQQGAVFEYLPNFDSLLIEQKNPWHVLISIEIDYSLKDVKNEFNWQITKRRIYAELNVEDYRDPFYLLETVAGKVSLQIKKTPYISFLNINDFKEHIKKVYFRDNTNAPSFIKRLKGDSSSDANGIES